MTSAGRVFSLVVLLLFCFPQSGWGQAREIVDLERRFLALFGAGRYEEAEQFLKRALALRENALGPEHPQIAASLGNLGEVYMRQDRYADAEPPLRRALAISERSPGPTHPDTAFHLAMLAKLYVRQARYSDAEPLQLRATTIMEKVRGQSHPETAATLDGLAQIYFHQGRDAEAEAHFKRALAIRERALGREHPDTIVSLSNLGAVYERQARYSDAEPLARRALEVREKALGREHPETAASLDNLAVIYYRQVRDAEAEALHKRALAIREKVLGREHPDTGSSLSNLAALYVSGGRYAEAEPLLLRALAISETVNGSEHPATTLSLNTLAAMYEDQGRASEAEPLFQRVLSIHEAILGREHPDLVLSLTNLASFYSNRDRHGDAEQILRRAQTISEKAFGSDHPMTAMAIGGIGRIKFFQGRTLEAHELLRQSTAIYVRSEQLRSNVGREDRDLRWREVDRFSWSFVGLIESAAALATVEPERRDALTAESFTTIQWLQRSAAANALASMTARFAKGDGPLAALVRQRQDLVVTYNRLDNSLIAASSKSPAERTTAEEGALRSKVAATVQQIDEIDRQLNLRFPEYAAVANPEPLTIAETQRHLRADEALYQLLVHNRKIFAWVVTKDGARFQALNIAADQMSEHVQTLRCGLDANEWEETPSNPQSKSRRDRCIELAGPRGPDGLPFDLHRAHALYEGLFGPFADMIRKRRLLIVDDGVLATLPFQVLVTAPPDETNATRAERYQKAAWMVAEHAIVVLPSVFNLKQLREKGGRGSAPEAYAAFANPLLTGSDGTDRSAWSKIACPKARSPRTAATRPPPRGTLRNYFRGNLADTEVLLRQSPLPETTDEVCAVASSLNANIDAVFLGARSTEKSIKELSRKGELKRFRVLHFATHGLIAKEAREIAGSREEPGLILSPPKTATEVDDGLLTASEVAQLELNADFVVLSACNTAAGDGGPNAKALSGLARAFLYAGARSLLVSHWAVNTWAAVDLVTGTFEAVRQEPTLSRAEALRRAMLEQLRRGETQAHPSYWAPLVIVGDG